MNNKIELTSELLPIVNIGTYTGQLCDPQNFLYDDFDFDYLDINKYMDALLEISRSYIKGFLKENATLLTELGIKDINVIKTVSPKYYNYSTDKLYFDLIVYNNFTDILIKEVEKHSDKLNKFLKDNYSSYDGFCSYTSNNIINLLEGIKEGSEQDISALLKYIFIENELISYEAFYYYVSEQINGYEVYTDYYYIKQNEMYDLIEQLKGIAFSYYNDGFETALIKVTDELTNIEVELSTEPIEIVREVFNSIDNNTLRLF